MEKQQKSWTTMKVYLLISSLAGLFGILIWFWIVISQFASFRIISDDEFVNNRYREVKQCEDPIYSEKWDNKTKSPEEIEKCKKEATDRLVIWRKYELKDSAVNGALRGLLFLIIFVVHYPKFVRYNKE